MNVLVRLLPIIQRLNTGLLLWDTVGPLIGPLLERIAQGDATAEEVDAAAAALDIDISELEAAVTARRAREAGGG